MSVTIQEMPVLILFLLTSEAARPLVKSSTLRSMPDLAVLSVPEVVK